MAKLKTKKQGTLIKRILAALVMLPVVIGALWAGYPYVDALIVLAGALLAWEWGNMAARSNSSAYVAAYVFSLSVAVLVYNSAFIWAVIALTTLFVWLKAKGESHRKLLTLGVAYISIGIGSLSWIYHEVFTIHPYNFYMTLWFCLMVWMMDIGGYFVGSTLKGPKMAPKISPNKTWSGLIGGVVFAMVASGLYVKALSLANIVFTGDEQMVFAVLGGLVAAISQIGDLIESAIKRHLGIKDSSNIIPGHGGVFDRVDGLMFAAPIVYWVFAYGLWYF